MHLAVFYTLYSMPSGAVQDVAEDKGKGGIQVGLGMQGSYQKILYPPKPKAVEKAVEKPIEKQAKKEVVKKPKGKPIQKQSVVKKEVKRATLKKNEKSVVYKAVPKMTKRSNTVEKTIEVANEINPKQAVSMAETTTDNREIEPAILEQQSAELKAEQATTQKAKTLPQTNKATGTKNDRRTGSKKGDIKSYFAELTNWLNQHKEYPVELKKAKQQGTVEVQFTFTRNGQIIQAKIKTSSGNTKLDKAALAMLKKANPLPEIPESFSRDSLTIAIPVEYSLITNKL